MKHRNHRYMNHILSTGWQGIVWLISLSLLGFSACHRTPKPGFSYFPSDNPEAGDTILFVNETRHADSYTWDFGDGEGSTRSDPEHIFASPGVFDVTLTAYNEGAESSLTRKLSIREPTLLGLIVLDSSGTPLQVAAIWIYDDPEAWEREDEPLASAYSGQDGTVLFTNMEPVIYYVLVSKTGIGGRWYFRGYTTELEQNESNWFNVPCRWEPDEPHQ